MERWRERSSRVTDTITTSKLIIFLNKGFSPLTPQLASMIACVIDYRMPLGMFFYPFVVTFKDGEHPQNKLVPVISYVIATPLIIS